MESTSVFIGSFILIFGIVWYVIRQREKQREKRFREFIQWRENRKKEHEEVAQRMQDYFKEAEEREQSEMIKKVYDNKGRQLGYVEPQKSKDRVIPSVPASDRINLDDSYMYQQQPFVANDYYKPYENNSSGFDQGFGGGDFSGGGSGGTWDDSSSSSDTYDSGVASEPNV